MPDKKISLVEVVLMLLIVGSVDFWEIIFPGVLLTINALPGVGQVMSVILLIVSFLLDWSILIIIHLWLLFKGIRGTWKVAGNLLGNIIEMVPLIGIDVLPIRSFVLLITILIHNHPAIGQALSFKAKRVK